MLQVRVAATSANLGPGFDALGLALDLDLIVRVQPSDRDRFTYRGDGHVPDSPHNLVHQGFRAVHHAFDLEPPHVAFDAENPIPLARGLGSSSAALVAGAALADALLGERLGRDGVFRLVARLEGHPDNVAPAIFGGFTVSAADEGGAFTTASLPLPQGWRLLYGVPDFELPTAKARAVLPSSYPRSDAVRTSGRAALWAVAVAADQPELLRVASLDVIHEPYRSPLVPGLDACRTALRAAGAYAAYLSGAGPTLGVIADDARADACRHLLQEFAGPGGRVLDLGPGTGYRVGPAPELE
ncbi:MAG: homoserine kinase [Deinococcales bacterium]